MNVGLFFGSYNPVHTGHLIIAEYILNYFTDRVWFVVSPQNPFKRVDDLLGVKDRVKMVESAINDNRKFKISEVELHLAVPSYTINTLNFLKSTYPKHNFSLIMGSDNFVTISKWRSSDILIQDYKIIIYERSGFKIDTKHLNPNILVPEAPIINISSTEIRKLIRAKKSIRYIVPDVVLKIIKKNKFYT